MLKTACFSVQVQKAQEISHHTLAFHISEFFYETAYQRKLEGRKVPQVFCLVYVFKANSVTSGFRVGQSGAQRVLLFENLQNCCMDF